ncbi:MAG TPA: hypothetical protein PKM87_06080 [Methanolinea sp.]|nr:MAG: hypothetical protein A4E41_01583 [Methanoregulaceae archaeon PtaU1.Bin066]HNQ29670.1 hypothetical protein [Methanolinea sp.]
MSTIPRSTNHSLRAILPGILILAFLLSAAGCSNIPGGGAASHNFWANITGQSGDACSFDRLTGQTDVHLTQGDSCYFTTHTPIEYLDDLRMHPRSHVLVIDVPRDWITPADVEHLMQEIDSTEPAAPVVSPLSSYRPFNQTSTVGNEALYLIEGYRAGKYPPALCSLHYFHPDKDEVRSWWEAYGRWNYPEEREAIRLIKEAYPDLKGYPADTFPVKSIRTERAPEGWYVAFIQEGSGVPIISARCYCVGNDRNITLTGTANQSVMVMVPEFSPKTCK